MTTTRSILVLIGLLASLCARHFEARAGDGAFGQGRGLVLTDEQRARLRDALAPLHQQYDPKERMLQRPFSSPGYHTTLSGGTVHPTRDSLNYAVALLDTGDDTLRQRAEDILTRVIALQDQNPTNRTYGIWSWFLEEPLDKMSPPDWNWADFCGVQLLQAALDHRERLSPPVRARVDDAIRHAARSIQRRNVGPSYTNIAIMGTYVTLVASELYGLADLKEYALARLRRFHDYTKEQGAFTEYNSPTYTMVALKEIARLRLHVKTSDARKMIDELFRVAWEEIATHFHAPTRQWAGPHSRCYNTLMKPEAWAFLHRATEGRVSFGSDKPSLDEHRLPMPIPRDFEPSFLRLDEPRELVKTFVRGNAPVVGTTYLDPAFALGSVNRGDTWNQRRPILAYWGDAQYPSYLQVRLLHDDYDFAAGRVFSAQRGGRLLAGLNFAVDGGDRHPSLHRIQDGRFQARDLRLRFEFGGAAGARKLEAPRSLPAPAGLRFGNVNVILAVPFAAFGEQYPHWESGQEDGKSWLDLVLLSGESRTVDLAKITNAAVGLVLQISSDEAPMGPVAAKVSEGRLQLVWERLEVEFPVRPANSRELESSFRAGVR